MQLSLRCAGMSIAMTYNDAPDFCANTLAQIDLRTSFIYIFFDTVASWRVQIATLHYLRFI